MQAGVSTCTPLEVTLCAGRGQHVRPGADGDGPGTEHHPHAGAAGGQQQRALPIRPRLQQAHLQRRLRRGQQQHAHQRHPHHLRRGLGDGHGHGQDRDQHPGRQRQHVRLRVSADGAVHRGPGDAAADSGVLRSVRRRPHVPQQPSEIRGENWVLVRERGERGICRQDVGRVFVSLFLSVCNLCLFVCLRMST